MESEPAIICDFKNQIFEYRQLQQEKYNKELEKKASKPLKPLNPEEFSTPLKEVSAQAPYILPKIIQKDSQNLESEITAIMEQIAAYESIIGSYQRRIKTEDKDLHTVIRSEISDYEQKILDLRRNLRLLLI